MSITFYHVEWCPECAVVREKLESLKVPFEDVLVPDTHMFRKQVFEVSGQYYVPVIKDDTLVLSETRDILAYLDDRYGNGAGHEARDTRPAFSPKTNPQDSKPDEPSEDDRYPSCRL